MHRGWAPSWPVPRGAGLTTQHDWFMPQPHIPGMAMPPLHPLAVPVPHPWAWQCQPHIPAQCQPHVPGLHRAAPGAECPETTAQRG